MAAASSISDGELRRQLKDLGQEVGPITAATRSLYLRKLAKLQKSGETNASPKSSAIKKGKAKSPSVYKRSPREDSSPSRRLVGFSSDEEESEPRRSRTRRKFSLVREKEARKEEEVSSRRTDSKVIKLRRSVLNPPQDESEVESSDQQDSAVSEPDGYVYRGTPLRLRSFNQSRLRRSPDSWDKQPEEFLGGLPRNSVQRQPGAEERKAHLPPLRLTFILLVALICIGALIYISINSPAFVRNILPNPGSLPLCEDQSLTQNKGSDCIKLADLCRHYALQYLYSTLSHQAGLFECGYTMQRNMSIATFKGKIREDNLKRGKEEQDKILSHTLKLVANNSHKWYIRLFDKDGKEVDGSDMSVVQLVDTSVATKPLLCRIGDASNLLMFRIFMILLGAAALLIIYFVVRHHWRREEEETRQMYHFVEKIIDILKEHHEASKNDKALLPYLPIPHVRDMLIPPSERQKLAKPWNRAVRFLSANESRIRVESQRMAGEDFEVWRWIHSVTPRNPSTKCLAGSKQGKFWQGQAFENFQSAVNPPIISPSPCLKIRNMFEPVMEVDESWHIMIQDAIVEKCTDSGANIVHIAVDKSSSEGCVYVKCDSHKSAGIAFRSLHGCWFDGRLVAVKYLTLKRYHQRFPAAQEATRPLKLSGKSPTSLVTFDPDVHAGDFNDSDVEV